MRFYSPNQASSAETIERSSLHFILVAVTMKSSTTTATTKKQFFLISSLMGVCLDVELWMSLLLDRRAEMSLNVFENGSISRSQAQFLISPFEIFEPIIIFFLPDLEIK